MTEVHGRFVIFHRQMSTETIALVAVKRGKLSISADGVQFSHSAYQQAGAVGNQLRI